MNIKPDFTQVHIIDASAGTGKTFTLAKKYISFLLNPELCPDNIPHKNILAITFTNKATNEMKQRILEFLKKIALDCFDNKEEEKSIFSVLNIDDRNDIQKRAYYVVDSIIKNYDFFRIQTIDSFINSVITGCSFKLDISPGFDIKTNYGDYLEYCLEKVIENSSDDKNIRKVLIEFIHHYLMNEFSLGWFPKESINEIIKKLFENINTYGLNFTKFNFTNKDIQLKKEKIYNLIVKLKSLVDNSFNMKFVNSLNDFVNESSNNFDICKLSSYFFKNKNVPLKKNSIKTKEIVNLWKEIQTELKELAEIESYYHYANYINIFEYVMDEFQTVTQKDNVLFLNELNRKAKILFDTQSITVPELYYRLATRFKYYLIDEFQDTSRLQWTNLLPMIEEALASGGSLFYVGDKKQAIYRFRGGDYGLINEVKTKFNNYNIKTDIINKNYRSQKEIVEFNNRIFSYDNLNRFLNKYNQIEAEKNNPVFSQKDIEDIIDIFSESQQKYDSKNIYGYVELEQIEIENNEDRNDIIKEKLIKLINELKERFDYSDIAILVRDNKKIELITKWLLEHGILVESENTLNIRENPFIKGLFSFLMFLNSPADNIAFVSFILSDIFIKETGLDRKQLHDFFFKIGISKQRNEKFYLYKYFQTEYPDIWEKYIEEFFSKAGFIPLYEFVITIFSRFNILKNLPEYQGFFMAFLELIKRQEHENYTLGMFIDYFNNADESELFVNVKRTNSLKVLTIHKAKGLEFDVVIMPFFVIDIIDLKRKISQEFVIYPEKNKLSLIKLNQNYSNFSDNLERKYVTELKISIINELNTAYVGLTRPKNELYLFIPIKNNSENIVKLLIPEKSLKLGQQMKYSKNKTVSSKTEKIPVSEYKDWIKLFKDEIIDDSRLRNRNFILKGEIIHHMLSFVDNLATINIEQQDQLLENILHNTKNKFLIQDEDIYTYKNIIKTVINSSLCKKFFYVTDGLIYREKEFVDFYGNTKRIDRLIIKKDEVWIVDFKISEFKMDDYYKQINDYIRILNEIYPNKNIIGFLVYIFNSGINVEQINGKNNNL